jgi:hypothetical protein
MSKNNLNEIFKAPYFNIQGGAKPVKAILPD